MKITLYAMLFYLGSARLLFERCSASKYSAEISTISCHSRSNCFNNEQLDLLDKEFSIDSNVSLPSGYDPIEWGWELTGFSIGTPL